MGRPRHQTKEFEALLRNAEDNGWRVEKGGRYFKCLCPCSEKHWVKVVLTPSSGRTLANVRAQFAKCASWS